MPTRRVQLANLALAAAAVPILTTEPASARGGAPSSAATIELSAQRTKINLPDVPALGTPYVTLLDLFDSRGGAAGHASAGSLVIDVTPQGPVVLGFVVLQLGDGDIHYQRIIRRHGGYPRTAAGAVTGGTGEYAGAAGQVDISWPDADRVDLVVHLT